MMQIVSGVNNDLRAYIRRNNAAVLINFIYAVDTITAEKIFANSPLLLAME